MGRNHYTVRLGDMDGVVLSTDYQHPVGEEPTRGERVNIDDGRGLYWRVISATNVYEPRTDAEANLLLVEPAEKEDESA